MSNSLQEFQSELIKKLYDSVKRNSADTLLLSGGIDSIAIASLYTKLYQDRKLKAITVGFEKSIDLNYASRIASIFKLEHHICKIDLEKTLSVIPRAIRILKTHHPNLANDLVIYFGLEYAQKLGIKSIMTGDGADELFSGYEVQNFSSNQLGKFFHIEIKQPYLDPELREFVLKNKIGKSVLRKDLSDQFDLPFEIVYWKKFPIEQTSGLAESLAQFIDFKITDEQFKVKKFECREIGINLENKKHLFYYQQYRKTIDDVNFKKQ